MELRAPDTLPMCGRVHSILRNTLTILGLHLGTLERLAGSAGHKAVAAIRQVAEMIEPIAPAGFRSQFPLPWAP